jgi:uncharacterized YigZ family protein
LHPVPARIHEAETEARKSRFIACAGRADTREQAMNLLATVRRDYPGASHYCWAYLLGDPASPIGAAMSDDGEPGGTAGRPILGVLQHKGVGNIMLVVARWFGGIKLGAGGLVRAYGGAASEVMKTLPVTDFVAHIETEICLPYAAESDFRRWLDRAGGALLEVRRESELWCRVALPEREQETLNQVAVRSNWRVSDSRVARR